MTEEFWLKIKQEKQDFSPHVQASSGPNQPCTHSKGMRYDDDHSPLPRANMKNV
jgi:hypothetical protein